mmetsp:Transcript_21389/g.27650  ORF Transcript_21389/g.27650 Transcript_21389/m.27650 type:complete len:358 (-) Transcript_21389:42-1115(-)
MCCRIKTTYIILSIVIFLLNTNDINSFSPILPFRIITKIKQSKFITHKLANLDNIETENQDPEYPRLDSRFDGIQRLYGEKKFELLKKSHVCVVGTGGVGSWAAEALARTGIGQITLIDLDDVCTSNINRQLVALSSTVGMQKIDVLKLRIREINPSCTINLVYDFLTKENVESLLLTAEKTPKGIERMKGRFDCVLDCIDGVTDKCYLIDTCRRAQMPVVTVGAAGGKRDPSQIKISDITNAKCDKLLARVRKLLRQRHGFPRTEKKQKNAEWGLPCVYSSERVSLNANEDKTAGFRKCDSQFGTATFVTGTFGFFAAALVCSTIIEDEEKINWSKLLTEDTADAKNKEEEFMINQ